MTYKEYVTAILGKFGLSDDEITFVLLEADLDPNKTVTGSDDKVKLKTAILNQIPLMIAGLSEVSEGGYAVKWNVSGLKAWYSVLASELGFEDALSSPTVIRDASNKW